MNEDLTAEEMERNLIRALFVDELPEMLDDIRDRRSQP